MTGKREQARAVLLALVVVISTVGMTMAFAGSAVASTNGMSLSDDQVAGGEKITVSGEVDSNGTVHAFIDVTDSGNYSGADDISASADVDTVNEDSSYEITLNTPGESGTYDVHVLQTAEVGTPLDTGDEGERTDQLDVDADAPYMTDETPEADSTVNKEDFSDISLSVTDNETSVTDLGVTITDSDSTIYTENIDPDTASGDGVSYENGVLTVTPGDGNVPGLSDGTYTATVEAFDEEGNSDSSKWTFDIKSEGLIIDSWTPAEDTHVVTDENQSVGAAITATDGSVDDSTVELTIEGADYSETFDYTHDAYTNESNTFDVNPENMDDVPSFDDGDYTVTVIAENDIGTQSADGSSFIVDTQGPSVDSISLDDAFGDNVTFDTLNNDFEDLTANVTFSEQVDPQTVTASVEHTSTSADEMAVHDDGKTVELFVGQAIAEAGLLKNDSVTLNVTAAEDLAGNSLTNDGADVSETDFGVDTVPPGVSVTDPGTLNGYVNISDHITVVPQDLDAPVDAGEISSVKLLADGEPVDDITDSIENLPTQEYADGEYSLLVNVTDENGNLGSDDTQVTLDNHAVDITQHYLDGVYSTEYAQGTDVAPEDIFTVNNIPNDLEIDETTYSVDGEKVDADEDISAPGDTVDFGVHVSGFDARDGADGDTFSETWNVSVEFSHQPGITVDGDNISVVIEESAMPENPAETFATVTETDDYADNSEVGNVSLAEFEAVDSLEHDTTYHHTFTVDRDGQYDVDGDAYSETVDVNTSAPDLESATVVDAGSDSMTVEAMFDQPIAGVSADNFEFDGASVDSVDAAAVDSSGGVQLTLSDEAQTFNTDLIATGVDSGHGDNTDPADTSVGVDAHTLDLDKGINYVSIPAESGSVDAADVFEGEAINAVFAYDGDSWSSYVPGASDSFDLEGGEGYVVNASADAEIGVNAQNVKLADDKVVPTSQNLDAGWNLIGHYQEGSQSIAQAFTPFDNQVSTMIPLEGTGPQVGTLEAGQGYWLYTDSEATHTSVPYDGAISDQPDVYNVQVSEHSGNDDDNVVSTDEKINISAEVANADAPTVEASGFGDTVTLTQQADGSYQATVDAGQLDQGDVSAEVVATDRFGNAGSAVSDGSVTVDTQANEAGLDASFDNAGDQITVTVSADEAVDTDNLAVSLDDEAGELGESLTEWNDEGGNTYEATYNVTAETEEEYTATLTTATDEAGNSMVADQTASASVDTMGPTIINDATMADDNSHVNVTFSEGVYGQADGSSALSADNVSLTFTGDTGATDVTISGVTTTAGDELSGGETTVQVGLEVTGDADGTGTIEVTPTDGSSVYDEAGNAASVDEATEAVSLNDQSGT